MIFHGAPSRTLLSAMPARYFFMLIATEIIQTLRRLRAIYAFDITIWLLMPRAMPPRAREMTLLARAFDDTRGVLLPVTTVSHGPYNTAIDTLPARRHDSAIRFAAIRCYTPIFFFPRAAATPCFSQTPPRDAPLPRHHATTRRRQRQVRWQAAHAVQHAVKRVCTSRERPALMNTYYGAAREYMRVRSAKRASAAAVVKKS